MLSFERRLMIVCVRSARLLSNCSFLSSGELWMINSPPDVSPPCSVAPTQSVERNPSDIEMAGENESARHTYTLMRAQLAPRREARLDRQRQSFDSNRREWASIARWSRLVLCTASSRIKIFSGKFSVSILWFSDPVLCDLSRALGFPSKCEIGRIQFVFQFENLSWLKLVLRSSFWPSNRVRCRAGIHSKWSPPCFWVWSKSIILVRDTWREFAESVFHHYFAVSDHPIELKWCGGC